MPDAQIQRVLALAIRAGSILVLTLKHDEVGLVEEILSSWLDQSGWPGRAVGLDADGLLEEEIAEASIILLPDVGDPIAWREGLSQTDAVEFLLSALDDGAIILAEGPAAETFGEAMETVLSSASGGFDSGLGWLPKAVIQGHFSHLRKSTILLKRSNLFRIGLPEGTALALGPQEEREVWGVNPPIITFGSEWTHGQQA